MIDTPKTKSATSPLELFAATEGKLKTLLDAEKSPKDSMIIAVSDSLEWLHLATEEVALAKQRLSNSSGYFREEPGAANFEIRILYRQKCRRDGW